MSVRPLTRPQTPAERAQSLLASEVGHRSLRERREERFADLEAMIRAGESPRRALERLGWTFGAADKAALRHDRPDIRSLIRRA